MVDPDRKINRLTDKDIEFLDECEEKFADRFTEDDEQFMEHCSVPLADPPLVDNWGFPGSGHHNNRGGGGQRNFYGGGHRHNRNHDYNRRDRGPDGGYRGRHRNNYTPFERSYNQRDDKPHQPMTIRRDYGNFVRASKE